MQEITLTLIAICKAFVAKNLFEGEEASQQYRSLSSTDSMYMSDGDLNFYEPRNEFSTDVGLASCLTLARELAP